MISLLLMLSLVHAEEAPSAQPAQASTFALDAVPPQARLREAWRRVDLGDLEGARILADEALALDGELAVEVAYLAGVTHQLAREHDAALEAYGMLLDQHPDSPRTHDAIFRTALVLADAASPAEARKVLRRLRPYRKLTDEARAKIAWSDATWLLEAGKVRPGVRRLVKLLDEATPDALTWFQARARQALLHESVERSTVLDFDLPERKVRAQLDARATYVFAAEAQLEGLVDLQETWFILDGLEQLAHAYVDLANDLLASPTPEDVSGIAEMQYRAGLQAKALIQLIKARKYLDLAITHVTRIGWQGDHATTLPPRLAALDARIEALDTPPEE